MVLIAVPRHEVTRRLSLVQDSFLLYEAIPYNSFFTNTLIVCPIAEPIPVLKEITEALAGCAVPVEWGWDTDYSPDQALMRVSITSYDDPSLP